MKVLITCPPMLGLVDTFRPMFETRGIELTCPRTVQTLSIEELLRLVPEHDGWIIGDDPANRVVLTAGAAGRLKAAVKWGVGVDNVDLAACQELGLSVANTPGMFGAEVADVALGYLIALARDTFVIDRLVRAGEWPKPRGISLGGRTVALIGFGDIGRHLLARLTACGLRVVVYDPGSRAAESTAVTNAIWPDRSAEADFVIVTCALTESSRRLLNAASISALRPGVRVVNVSRGAIVDEAALVTALDRGHVHSAALDVFEIEPLPAASPLREHARCVFGSHNASNTEEAVIRASRIASARMLDFLGVKHDI
jgi:D-3-phosphoglycerate dehydrogenase / 2-oxoglutarate reductase